MHESSDPEETMFATYGRTMCTAQDLEGQLLSLSLLVGAHAQGGLGSPGLADLDRQLSKKTLGALLRWLEDGGYIERSMHGSWFRALEIRNTLAHCFFLDRTELLLVRQGQLAVVKELETAGEILYRVRNEVRSVLPEVLHALGVNVEAFLANVAEEKRKILGSE